MHFFPLLLVTGLAFQPAPVQTASVEPVSNTGLIQPQAAPEPVNPEMRCDIMIARKMYRDAIDCYQAAGASKSAILSDKVGIAYHQLGELDHALKYYKQAEKLNPEYAEAINNIGTVYYSRKNYRRAISEYEKALKLRPDSAPFLSNLGTAYFARKKFQEASDTYLQALRIDPDVFEHHNLQGTAIQDQSVEELAKYHYYIAKTYAEAGDAARALQYMRKSLEEGFKDRDKFVKEPAFAKLQDNPQFKEILAEEQKVL